MGAHIRVPSASDDRPRNAVLWVAALVGAGLGTATVALTARVEDTLAPKTGTVSHAEPRAVPQGGRSDPAEHAAPTRADDAEPARAAAEDEAQQKSPQEPAADAEPAAVAAAALPPAERAPLAPAQVDAGHTASARVTQVVAGRVAYVRCDGLSVRSGPYPCPRDRLLEAAVWDALDLIPQCADAHPSGDEPDTELRLEFRGNRVSDARFRVSGAARHDAETALDRCLREPLGNIATRLRPSHMVVSFRFRLL